MKLAFLGSGAAFSVERYNGAIVVDDRLLLDAGAPLLPHMHRLGIDPGAIEAVFLTHCHGDHILGLPPFMLYRSFIDPRPLVIVGPPGFDATLESLFQLSWGAEWPVFRAKFELQYEVAAWNGVAGGVAYATVKLQHGTQECRGYRLHIDGRLLAYAGDTTATPPLDQLVAGADIAITEATGPDGSGVHTDWTEAEELATRHPGTRFIFNHLFAGAIRGGVRDLEVLEV